MGVIQQRGKTQDQETLSLNWSRERAVKKTACGDTAIGGSKALHRSDKGEGREGGPRERRELSYGGQEGRVLYELLLFCQCNVRSQVICWKQNVEG